MTCALGHTVVGWRLEPWSTQRRNMDLTLALDDTMLVAEKERDTESSAPEGLDEASLGMWLGSCKGYSECPICPLGWQESRSLYS